MSEEQIKKEYKELFSSYEYILDEIEELDNLMVEKCEELVSIEKNAKEMSIDIFSILDDMAKSRLQIDYRDCIDDCII